MEKVKSFLPFSSQLLEKFIPPVLGEAMAIVGHVQQGQLTEGTSDVNVGVKGQCHQGPGRQVERTSAGVSSDLII